jgi:hypothetical protein
MFNGYLIKKIELVIYRVRDILTIWNYNCSVNDSMTGVHVVERYTLLFTLKKNEIKLRLLEEIVFTK